MFCQMSGCSQQTQESVSDFVGGPRKCKRAGDGGERSGCSGGLRLYCNLGKKAEI